MRKIRSAEDEAAEELLLGTPKVAGVEGIPRDSRAPPGRKGKRGNDPVVSPRCGCTTGYLLAVPPGLEATKLIMGTGTTGYPLAVPPGLEATKLIMSTGTTGYLLAVPPGLGATKLIMSTGTPDTFCLSLQDPVKH